MPLRWQEVALPLILIVTLIFLKYVPMTADLPLARAAGVVAFGYAAFLALRLVQSEEAVTQGGWSELRPSMMEYFACYTAAGLAVALMAAVILVGATKHVDPTQLVATFVASLLLGAGAALIAINGLMVKLRWNHRELEQRTAFGREIRIAWSDVRVVQPNWRGVSIVTHDRREISFSQFHSGAAQLAIHATTRARRNAESATKAFATL